MSTHLTMPSQPLHHTTFKHREKKTILNFLSHPCNHCNPTSTSIRNASKAFRSEDFAKMLLIFLWFCAEEYFSFNFFCTSKRWKVQWCSDAGFYHGKSASGCRLPLPEQLYFLWILARNPWISRNKRSAHTMYCIPLHSMLPWISVQKIGLPSSTLLCRTWINNSLSTANFSNFTSSFST